MGSVTLRPIASIPYLHFAKIFLWRMTLFQSKTFETIFAKCVIMEGLTPGKELDQMLQKYKIAVKSHRRIGINE